MIKIVSRNILRFIVLLLVQVFLLNNIQLNGFLNPYVYVLFLILLPFETPKWLLLVLSFFMGLMVDMFSYTPGVHASAMVFAAFIRPTVLNFLGPRDGYESGTYPRIFYYGLPWFLKYALTITFMHHLVLFYIDAFKFDDFFHTMLRVVLSTIFSITIIILSQYFVYRK